MGRISTIFLLLVFALPGLSQKEDKKYNKRSIEIQKDIWQDTLAAFQVKQIPVELNNESAVIIAKYNKILSRYDLSSPSLFQKTVYEGTFRQRLKINDKAALEKYSSIEYLKKMDINFSGIQNKVTSYIGAKVIKPAGLETIINTSEEVLTENENKYKEAKLAIPGLQVGDILDYYIKIESSIERANSKMGPLTFFIREDYPVLYYSIKLQVDDKFDVDYITANGAPSLNESTNESGDIILELTQTNIPKFNSSLFTSPFREYPYITLQCRRTVSRGYDNPADLTSGQVKQGHLTTDLVNQLIQKINGGLYVGKYPPLIITQNYFGGVDRMNAAPKDSVIEVLYNAWRYFWISEWLKDAELPVEIKNRYASSLDMAVYFSRILSSLNIDNTIYLVRSRNSGSLQNVMNVADFNALLKFKSGNNRSYWLAFDDIFTQFNEIPIRFQGEEAITLRPEKTESFVKYIAGQGKVPVTIPEYNSTSENLDVSFDSLDINVLHITRNCSQTGALRHEYQKNLLLTENIKESMAKTIEQNNVKLEEKLSDNRKVQLAVAFTNERNNLKTSFEEDISQHFDAKPTNMSDYEIIHSGLYTYRVPFEYKTSFNLENYVKKAGSNYLLEVGKLIGVQQEIKEKDRSRNIDVFLSSPTTYSWVINIRVPEGYDVKGIDELSKTVSNETGSFNCTATNDGHIVNIRIKTVCAHNFEKAANWPKLLDIMDALNNFVTQKILLEKHKS